MLGAAGAHLIWLCCIPMPKLEMLMAGLAGQMPACRLGTAFAPRSQGASTEPACRLDTAACNRHRCPTTGCCCPQQPTWMRTWTGGYSILWWGAMSTLGPCSSTCQASGYHRQLGTTAVLFKLHVAAVRCARAEMASCLLRCLLLLSAASCYTAGGPLVMPLVISALDSLSQRRMWMCGSCCPHLR